jgi:hypothetical protein
VKKASRLKLAIRKHIVSAINGDVSSAAMLLRIRAHAKKHGDTGPTIITINNALPPLVY